MPYSLVQNVSIEKPRDNGKSGYRNTYDIRDLAHGRPIMVVVTMCVRVTIPARPHEIEVSEGVSIFVKVREIKILPLYRIRMVGYERNFDFLV